MSGLKIGDRVRTPDGVGVIASADYHGARGSSHDVALRVTLHGQPTFSVRTYPMADLSTLPADIPRERIEAYHAELVERAASLRAFSAPSIPGGDLCSWLAAEVQKIADELREMLEVPDAE